MDKRRGIVNCILLCVLAILVVAIVFLYKNYMKEYDRKEAENAKIAEEKKADEEESSLKEIAYLDEVSKIGCTNGDQLAKYFAEGYSQHDGKIVAQVMDFVAGYIYINEIDSDESKFDEKYVEVLKDPDSFEHIVLLRYMAEANEKSLIELVNNTNVEVTLENPTKIKDETRYISKMTADLRTVSEAENINQVDKVEFVLLHRKNTYYIITFYVVDENGNKVEN